MRLVDNEEDEHGVDEGAGMNDIEARMDELMAAVQALSARLAAVEAAKAPAEPLAPAQGMTPGGVPLGKVRVVRGVRLSGGSSSASLVQDFVDIFVHLGSSSAANLSSSYSSRIMEFAAEEV